MTNPSITYQSVVAHNATTIATPGKPAKQP
jgi:hypothetical protein